MATFGRNGVYVGGEYSPPPFLSGLCKMIDNWALDIHNFLDYVYEYDELFCVE